MTTCSRSNLDLTSGHVKNSIFNVEREHLYAQIYAFLIRALKRCLAFELLVFLGHFSFKYLMWKVLFAIDPPIMVCPAMYDRKLTTLVSALMNFSC